MAKWGLLTNHALLLIHLYENPRSTLREISAAIGITERAALSIIRQVELDDCVRTIKEGRRNRYTVNLPAIMGRQTPGPYTIEQIVIGLSNLLGFRQRDGST